MSRFLLNTDSKGQVLVEYILMIALALSLMGFIGYSFRRITSFVWQQMTCEIAAPCPHCPSDPSIKNRLYPGACKD